MRIAYFDGAAGIAGDMAVGALLDAGLDFDALREGLTGLGVGGYALRAERVKKKGVMATKFHVDLDPGGEKPHRHLRHIVEIIDGSALPDEVKQGALKTFQKLAEAEATVHGTTIEKVHFHEVGAVDAIVDIVGIHYGLHLLGVGQVHAAPPNVGGGTVTCEHGVMPVPAPATARLLQGLPTHGTADIGELVTPTGAAFLAATAASVGDAPPMQVDAIGYGSGTRDLPDRANVVRVQLGESAEGTGATESVTVIACNVDDATGELVAATCEALHGAGARDVYVTPVGGKKGRPAQLITVLAAPSDAPRLAECLLTHSTTFGVRMHEASRYVLERDWQDVSTRYGSVRIKLGRWRGAVVQRAPEFEDCTRCAAQAGVPVRDVYAAALAAAQELA